MPASRLLEGSFQIAARSQSHDLKAIRIGFGDIKRAAANRARRSQDGNAFHTPEFLFYALLFALSGAGGGEVTASRAKLHSTIGPARQRAGHQCDQASRRGLAGSLLNL